MRISDWSSDVCSSDLECSTLLTELEVDVDLLTERKDNLFRDWEIAYAGTVDYVAIPVLETLKLVGTLAAIAIGLLELAAILGVSSAGAFVAANQAGLATLGTIDLSVAIAETLSSWATKIYDSFQTGDAPAKLRDFGAYELGRAPCMGKG